MGAFHAGHLALIGASTTTTSRSSACSSIPRSSGRRRTWRATRATRRDAAAAEAAGVGILFVPSAEEIYPPGFDTWVDPELATVLEGAMRPGHFRGVATVCTKLFDIVQPARAYFGRKDAQQVAVVKVVRDLAMPLEIVACPTVRDPDGWRSPRATPISRRMSGRVRWPCRAPWRRG